ncbi:MAG: type II secretion system protein GspL [Gammaproteobacteria bacterium]|nr:type II secretion system protein GspL [Gammaproteobacteria bacterium]
MRETLLIRLTEPCTDAADSVCLGEAGKPLAGSRRGTLAEAAEQAAGRRVVVLVPGSEVLLTRVAVPTTNRQRARKAIPFALEDLLAEDIDGLHFALGPRDAEGQWPVAVVARTRMDEWLRELHAVGILPDRVLPEALALPLTSGSGGLLLETDGALLRDQPWSAQVLAAETLPAVMELLVSRNEAGIDLHVWLCGGELPVWLERVSAKVEPCTDGALRVFATGLAQAEELDLLQGPYSRKEQYGRLLRPWRAAAALLLVGVVVSAIQLGLRYRDLQSESAALATQIEAVYKQAFPGGRIVNPRAQMEQQLNSLRRQQGGVGNDFLGLVAQLGGVFAATPGIELTGANFRDGYLDVELTAGDVQVLDSLKQKITAKGGLSVDIQSATTGADQRVQGRLRIQGAAS